VLRDERARQRRPQVFLNPSVCLLDITEVRGDSGYLGGLFPGSVPVRTLTRLDRYQVNRLIHELEAEGEVRMEGHGRSARHVYVSGHVGSDESQ